MILKREELAHTAPRREPGSSAAFDALFQEHWPKVYGVLVRLVGDRAEAEDLALEVFWRLHQRPPSTAEGNLGGWLYRVATNLGFNALRTLKRRQHYEAQAGRGALDTAAVPSPAAEVERRDEQARVRRTLAQMKPRSAQLLILRYSDLSYAEIASVLGVASGSVGTLLARAEQEFEQHYRAMEGVS